MGSGHCGPRCRRIHPGGRGGAGTGSGGCHPANRPVSPAHPGNWVLPGKAQVPPTQIPCSWFATHHVQGHACSPTACRLLRLQLCCFAGPSAATAAGAAPPQVPPSASTQTPHPPTPRLVPRPPPWGSVSAAWIPPNNLLTAGSGLSPLSPALGSLLPEVRFPPPSEFSNSSSTQSLPMLSATAANHCHYGSLRPTSFL